jgi:hypothetical protein
MTIIIEIHIVYFIYGLFSDAVIAHITYYREIG